MYATAVVTRPALRSHVRTAILDAAARVLAGGDEASMAAIADAAGVSRATLYRYFPSRTELLHGLTEAAITDLGSRLTDADLALVPVREGIARVSRAFLAAGTRYAALVHTGGKSEGQSGELDRVVVRPVRELLARGVEDGSLRRDLSPEVLLEVFACLLEHGLRLVLAGRLGVEQAGATVVTVFLDGSGPSAAPRGR